MATNPKPISEADRSTLHQIMVQGRLDLQWSDWFEGFAVKPQEDGTTLLIGPVVDDAALYGLLKKVRDSGLRLLSVNQIESVPEETADYKLHQDPADEIKDK